MYLFYYFNEKGSIVSEASYTEASYAGDQQKTLMEVLSYCQVFFFFVSEIAFKQF